MPSVLETDTFYPLNPLANPMSFIYIGNINNSLRPQQPNPQVASNNSLCFISLLFQITHLFVLALKTPEAQASSFMSEVSWVSTGASRSPEAAGSSLGRIMKVHTGLSLSLNEFSTFSALVLRAMADAHT